jgi:hypothetical protein
MHMHNNKHSFMFVFHQGIYCMIDYWHTNQCAT